MMWQCTQSYHTTRYTHRHTDDGSLMALKHFDAFSFEQIPASDGLVRRSCVQHLAVGVCGHARDCSCVLLQHVKTLAGLERPGARREIRGSRHQDVLVTVPVEVLGRHVRLLGGDEYQRVYAPLVAAEHSDALPRVKVPASGRTVVGGAEDEVPGANDPVDHGVVTFEDVHAVARAHVPLPDGLVGAASDHVVILYTDTVDVLLVALQDPYVLTALGLGGPQSGGSILAACGQHGPVFTEGHTVNTPLVVLHCLHKVGFVLGVVML